MATKKSKTKKIVGGVLFLGAIAAGIYLYKTGKIGIRGLGQLQEQGGRSKGEALRWMEQVQSYRNEPGGAQTIQNVNRRTGATDATATAFYEVLKRNSVESPNLREYVGPDGIGRPY